MKKVVIIGSNHSAIAATNILTKEENISVTLYEKNEVISFLGCLSSLCLSQEVPISNKLFYTSPKGLQESGATIHMQSLITKIDFDKKILYGKSLVDQNEFEDTYDILILSTGSTPTKIEGYDLQSIKAFDDALKIDNILDHNSVKDVIIVGAGAIGLELAEAAYLRRKNVTMIEKESSVLFTYFDSFIAGDIEEVLDRDGITLKLESSYDESYEKKKDAYYPEEIVISAIGVSPNVELAKDALELGPNNSYLVNGSSQTSRKDVYAIGDCASVYSNVTHTQTYCPQASHAYHSGVAAANHIVSGKESNYGNQLSFATQVLGLNLYSTGITSHTAKEHGYEPYIIDRQEDMKYEFMSANFNYKLSIVCDKNTDRILGVQMSSKEDISGFIHMYSLAIAKQCTLDEIQNLDLFFHPQFNKLVNAINTK